MNVFETATLSAGPLAAELAPAAGMACLSLRDRGEELLDRRAGLSCYVRTGAVMGVPLLYPWANRLAGHDYALDGHDVVLPHGPPLVHCEEHGLPIHGLLHASPLWRLTAREETSIAARLDFGAHPELLAAFPFPHTLEIDATLLGDRLRIATTVRPTSGTAVPIAFGFHPHLRLPGAPRDGWQITLPPRRHCSSPRGAARAPTTSAWRRSASSGSRLTRACGWPAAGSCGRSATSPASGR